MMLLQYNPFQPRYLWRPPDSTLPRRQSSCWMQQERQFKQKSFVFGWCGNGGTAETRRKRMRKQYRSNQIVLYVNVARKKIVRICQWLRHYLKIFPRIFYLELSQIPRRF